MTTVVVKNIYPADIYYSDSLSGLFHGDVISEDDTTNMRQILDAELNAPDPSNTWELDIVQDIFYRQGKLHIACQSEHVKLLTSRLSSFLETLIEAVSEADLATVCGIRDYNPYKNPEIEFIRNYGESGIKQVELTTSAPADIDMDLLQKLISDQKLATYEGPVQPSTFNRAPKATYHPRGREPIELDKSSAESATFWAAYAKPIQPTKTNGPPAEPTREPNDHTTLSSMTHLTAFSTQIQSLQAANSSQLSNITQLTLTTEKLESEMIALKAAIGLTQSETQKLQAVMTTLAASSTELHASQVKLAHSVDTINSTVNKRMDKVDEKFSTLMDFLATSNTHKKQRTTAAVTNGTQDTSTPGTQEPQNLTDLSQARESDVNMAGADE
jgi:hypothetical protein